MKKISLGLIVLAISLLFFNFSAYAKEKQLQNKIGWVIAEEGVNVRSLPETKGNKPIDTLEYLTEVEYVKDSCIKGWGLIKYKDGLKYVAKEWISSEEPERAAGPVEQYIEPEPAYQNLEPVQDTPAAAYTGTYFYATCFITHYCPCSIWCGSYAAGYTANGSYATPNWTVAAGSDLPFGTRLLINGQEYEVQDRGVGYGCIDIFCSSHQEALARGAYYTDVYIIN